MLYQWIRLIRETADVLTDLSIENQEEGTTVPMDIANATDYMYLGQHFPFNNFWMQVDSVNAIAANIEIDYWAGTGSGWKPALDILDATKVSGVPLAKSGVVQFSPDRSWIWHRVSDTENEPMPLGLENLTIYNIYWLRFRYSADLTGTTTIKRLAYAFTQSQQLDNIDTQINQFQDSFESGKTDWDDEIYTASIQLVNDLRRRNLITHYGQVLRFDDVTMAADLKALALIYKNLGPGFRTKLEDALAEYEKVLDVGRFTFDKDLDAFVDQGEITNKVKKLVR